MNVPLSFCEGESLKISEDVLINKGWHSEKIGKLEVSTTLSTYIMPWTYCHALYISDILQRF